MFNDDDAQDKNRREELEDEDSIEDDPLEFPRADEDSEKEW